MPPIKKKKSGPREIQGLDGSNTNAGSSAKLKKKIRDLERLLKRPNLNATVKIETERALVALKAESESIDRNKTVAHNAKKYHMVRFFERKKAYRKLKQTLKQLLTEKENKKYKKAFKESEIDLYYTLTFPLHEKYISLYPNESAEASKDKRLEFRDKVKQEIKQGTYPTGLDEHDKSRAMAEFHKRHEFNAKNNNSHSNDKQQQEQDNDRSDEDGNDGDEFFE